MGDIRAVACEIRILRRGSCFGCGEAANLAQIDCVGAVQIMALPLADDEHDAEQQYAELILLWLRGCAKQGVVAAGGRVGSLPHSCLGWC